jgi:hypothetical protein
MDVHTFVFGRTQCLAARLLCLASVKGTLSKTEVE